VNGLVLDHCFFKKQAHAGIAFRHQLRQVGKGEPDVSIACNQRQLAWDDLYGKRNFMSVIGRKYVDYPILIRRFRGYAVAGAQKKRNVAIAAAALEQAEPCAGALEHRAVDIDFDGFRISGCHLQNPLHSQRDFPRGSNWLLRKPARC
jgi:hypothetical protein